MNGFIIVPNTKEKKMYSFELVAEEDSLWSCFLIVLKVVT